MNYKKAFKALEYLLWFLMGVAIGGLVIWGMLEASMISIHNGFTPFD